MDECVCVYMLYGYVDSIFCFFVDKVRCNNEIEYNVMQLSCNKL